MAANTSQPCRASPRRAVPASDAATEIASLLRSINVSLLGILRGAVPTGSLLLRVRRHLEHAARHITQESPDPSLACGDLQVACECAMKATLDHVHRRFPKTHDLRELHAKSNVFQDILPLSALGDLPSAKQMVDIRYGTRRPPSMQTFFSYYRTALTIVQAALKPIAKVGLEEAQFEIAKAPWLKRD